jgi:hypothetical protein
MREDHMGIDFTYLEQPPKRWTFEQPKLKAWVEKWCVGRVLNLFAGKTLLTVDEFRVDIDTDNTADYHGDSVEFAESLAEVFGPFDTLILDPPYNVRKGREKYEKDGKTYHKGRLTIIKDAIIPALSPRARVISLGYDTVGMSASRGFDKIAICLVCHSGDHNDTLCLVEQRSE